MDLKDKRIQKTLDNFLYVLTSKLRANPDNETSSLFHQACLLFGEIYLILLQKVGGRQVTFTKTLENKEFGRKLVKNF